MRSDEPSRPVPPRGRLWNQAETCRKLIAESQTHILGNGEPADRYLSGIFRAEKKYGSKDRAFLSETLFAFYRRLGWIRKCFGTGFLSAQELSLPLLAALAAEALDFPAAEVWCTETGVSAGQWNTALNSVTPEARFEQVTGLAVSAEELVPDAIKQEFRSGDLAMLLPVLSVRPPLWLRANDIALLPKICREFEASGLTAETHETIKNAIRISGKVNLNALEGCRQGWFEVQDLSSQCIGIATGAQPGQFWWDVCAGAGGKTIQLDKLMGGKGRITASDIYPAKLDELKKRAARSRCAMPETRLWNGAEKLPVLRTAAFDGVLVDAPCSSSGRWRRNPELRWQLSPERPAELAELQFTILSRAAAAVKPGGRLVYATCSLFPREDEDVVRRFLAGNPDFELEEFPHPLNGKSTGGLCRILPAEGNCDGSFAARMHRKGSAV